MQVARNENHFDLVCKKTNELKSIGFDNLLLLGGEPLMYRKLEKLLENVHDGAKSIVTTTNGSLLHNRIKLLKKYFTKIHVSIHHYDEAKNAEIYRTCFPSFDKIRKAIHELRDSGVEVCINTMLYRDYIDSSSELDKMVEKAKWFGAHRLRVRELKTFNGSIFVYADEVVQGLTKKPFREGCETIVPGHDGIVVTIKNMCGYPSEIKRDYYCIKDTGVYKLAESCGIQSSLENVHFKVNKINNYSQLKDKTFCVLYTDGSLYDGWATEINES
jgi:MoaA/NifB/PqqE/SkfB family radical SAM enzyme